MVTKTIKERQESYKDRRVSEGLKEIRSLYAHPDDFKQIRAYVVKLNTKTKRVTCKVAS